MIFRFHANFPGCTREGKSTQNQHLQLNESMIIMATPRQVGHVWPMDLGSRERCPSIRWGSWDGNRSHHVQDLEHFCCQSGLKWPQANIFCYDAALQLTTSIPVLPLPPLPTIRIITLEALAHYHSLDTQIETFCGSIGSAGRLHFLPPAERGLATKKGIKKSHGNPLCFEIH